MTNSHTSIEDAFFTYAKGRISLSPSMLADYLQKAADFCHLKQPLLGMTDVQTVRFAQQKVAEGKLLRFLYRKDAQMIRDVTHLYFTFITSYRATKEEPSKQIEVLEGKTTILPQTVRKRSNELPQLI